MPDFGTFITDAKGVVHDLLKHRFDATSHDTALTYASPLLTHSVDEAFGKFKESVGKKLGLDIKEFSMESIGEQIKEQLFETGTRLTTEAVLGAATKYLGDLEGPLGLLISEGMSILTGELAFLALKSTDYTPGQWVFLDCSVKKKMINAIPKVIQLDQVNDFFDGLMVPDIPDELDYIETEAKHAIGFVLGMQENGYEYTVFSYLTGSEEIYHKDKIRPCPQSYAERLDDDPDFSKLREIVFMKDHDPTLNSYIPTEPGQVVHYKKEPYVILDQSEDEYYIVNKAGKTVRCKAGDLDPGRTENNATWNHRTTHLGGYPKNNIVYSGQWVWIKANDFVDSIIQTRKRRLQEVPELLNEFNPDSQILAMVKSVEGSKIHLVRGYDGSELDEDIRDVHTVSSEVASILNRKFSKWKFNELNGLSIDGVPTPGEDEPLLSLGIGELTEEEPTFRELPDPAKKTLAPVRGNEFEDSVVLEKLIKLDDALDDVGRDGERFDVSVEYENTDSSDTSSLGPIFIIVGLAFAYNYLT